MARLLGKMRDENLSDGQRYQFENERTSYVLVATASELAAKRKEIEQEQCREVPDSELLTIEIRQADIITSTQANLEQMKSILTNAAANPDGAGVATFAKMGTRVCGECRSGSRGPSPVPPTP
jgi:hypothetical protein